MAEPSPVGGRRSLDESVLRGLEALATPRSSLALLASVSPSAALHVLQRQQVAVTCHHLIETVEALGQVSGLAEPLVSGLALARVEQWQRSERWLRELARIDQHLHERACDYVVLKGLGLALLDYGGADRRAFGDLDLLVAEADAENADSALVSAGYRRTSTRLERDKAKDHLHHVVYAKPPFSVDLHQSVRAHPTFRLDREIGRRDSRSFLVLGRTIKAPSAQDQLLTLLLGLHDDIGLGTAAWKTLWDCSRVLDGLSDNSIRSFLEERSVDRTLRITVNMLFLVAVLLPDLDSSVRVGTHLTNHAALLRPFPGSNPHRLFLPRSLWPAKHWSLSLYDQSAVHAWWSWLTSLPVRIRAHRTSSRRPDRAARR